MFNLGNKGQSSSVFNLLIAALVALAILGLLLSILGGIGFNSGNKPIDSTITLVKDAMNTPFSMRSQTVTFTKSDNAIPKKSVKNKTDIGDALKFTNCDVAGGNIEATDNGIIFNGTSNQQKKVFVMCGDNVSSEEFTFPSTITDCSVDTVPEFTCYVIVTPQIGG